MIETVDLFEEGGIDHCCWMLSRVEPPLELIANPGKQLPFGPADSAENRDQGGAIVGRCPVWVNHIELLDSFLIIDLLCHTSCVVA